MMRYDCEIEWVALLAEIDPLADGEANGNAAMPSPMRALIASRPRPCKVPTSASAARGDVR